MFLNMETFIIFGAFNKTILNEIFRDKIFRRSERVYFPNDRKTIQKIFYNIDLAEQTNDPRLFKKNKMTFGSFGQISQEFKSDFLRFGTRQITKKLW